jgi:hypothetical protein
MSIIRRIFRQNIEIQTHIQQRLEILEDRLEDRNQDSVSLKKHKYNVTIKSRFTLYSHKYKAPQYKG